MKTSNNIARHHMALSVNDVSSPNLMIWFGTKHNGDLPLDDWPTWCLEFMYNHLSDYFADLGARWMPQLISIRLAKKDRWITVKYMNWYFPMPNVSLMPGMKRDHNI